MTQIPMNSRMAEDAVAYAYTGVWHSNEKEQAAHSNTG